MAVINIRVGAERKKMYEAEAKNQGLSVSEWLRDLADTACGRADFDGEPIEEPVKPAKVAKTVKGTAKQLSEVKPPEAVPCLKMLFGIPHYEVKRAGGGSDWVPYKKTEGKS